MRNKMTLSERRGLAGWIFVFPWLLGFTFLLIVPFIQSMMISMSRIHITRGGYTLEKVGFGNYVDMFTSDPEYVPSLIEAMVNMTANVPVILIFSIFAAALLNRKFPGRTLTRAVFFLPVILASGVVLRIQSQDKMQEMMQMALSASELNSQQLTSYNLQALLRSYEINEFLVEYIIDAVSRIKEIISASGVQILVFLAALESIPASYYEAASMEGATGWESFWKITFPMLVPIFLANAVYTIIDSFTAFNNPIMELVKTTAFGRSSYGLGSAMAWGYFASIAAVLFLLFLLWGRKIEYYDY
ncbi:MAG: sugar ABC transporter permease [Spirochaetales bacterium]|nr:sugar ABC transporter permease [Spirochaetales bacterium]